MANLLKLYADTQNNALVQSDSYVAGGCTPWETAVYCPLVVGYSKANRGQLTASSSTPRKKQKTQPRRWLLIWELRFRNAPPSISFNLIREGRVRFGVCSKLSCQAIHAAIDAIGHNQLMPIWIEDDEQHGAKNRETAQNNFSLYGSHRRNKNKK